MGKFNFGRKQNKGLFISPGVYTSEPPPIQERDLINRNRVINIEPLTANRFIITANGIDIPERNFQSYDLIYNNDEFIFTVNFYDSVNHWFNPNDLSNITTFIIQYLNPRGNPVTVLNINVLNVISFERHGSYSDSGLLINKLSFNVNVMQY
jgi:hypothetical protein